MDETAIRTRRLLFLSHASADMDAAYALAMQIEQSPAAREAGLTVWIDKRDLRVGHDWVEQLETTIARDCCAFAVYVTQASLENWVRMEISLALERVVTARRSSGHFPFVPLLVGGRSNLGRLPPFARLHHGIEIEPTSGLGIERLLGLLLGAPEGRPTALFEEPFLGLEAFGTNDVGLFFGRSRQIEDVLRILSLRNFALVIGDSGCGKSSLVKAGVVPAFLEGRLGDRLQRHVDRWVAIVMRPRGDPFEGLIESLDSLPSSSSLAPASRSENYRRIRSREPSQLRDAIRSSVPEGCSILLVVDQFEELWTQSDDATRRRFVDFLVGSTPRAAPGTPPDLRLRVLGTMRRDHFNLCTDFYALNERLEGDGTKGEANRGVYLLGRIGDIREIVVKPLVLSGIEESIAEELASNIEKDVSDQPGDLALVEMALTETWRRRADFDGDIVRTYGEIGRVEGALASAAEFVLKNLDPSLSEMMEPLFLRLVKVGDLGGTTRRSVPAKELSPRMRELAKRLAEPDCRRLLVTGGTEECPTYEIAHERLSSRWNTYHRWLRVNSDGSSRVVLKRILDRLLERLAAQEADKVADLPRGRELEDLRRLRATQPMWLTEREHDFIARAERSARNQRLMWIGLAVVILALSVGLVGSSIRLYITNQELEERLASEQAAGWWNRLELRGSIEPSEAAVLLELARGSIAARDAFFTQLKATDNLAVRFRRQPFPLVRAIVGIDCERRKTVAELAERVLTAPTQTANRQADIAALVVAELEWSASIPSMLAALRAGIDNEFREGVLKKVFGMLDSLSVDQKRSVIDTLTQIQDGSTASGFRFSRMLELCETCDASTAHWIESMLRTQWITNKAANLESGWLLQYFARLGDRLSNPGEWIDEMTIQLRSDPREPLQVLWGEELMRLRASWSAAQRDSILSAALVRSQAEVNVRYLRLFGYQSLVPLRHELSEEHIDKLFVALLDTCNDRTPDEDYALLLESASGPKRLEFCEQMVERLAGTAPPSSPGFVAALLRISSELPPNDAATIASKLVEIAVRGSGNESERRIARRALNGMRVGISEADRQRITGAWFSLPKVRDVEEVEKLCEYLSESNRVLDSSSNARAIEFLRTAFDFTLGSTEPIVEGYSAILLSAWLTLDSGAFRSDWKAAVSAALRGESDSHRTADRKRILTTIRDSVEPTSIEAFTRDLLVATLECHELSWQEVGIEVLVPLLERMSDESLVRVATELFKFPRLPRTSLLALLRQRFPSAPAERRGFWPLIEWLVDEHPDWIDTKSPPQSPGMAAQCVELIR